MQKSNAAKLEAVESSIRRWHTRLVIASNKIRKLEAKRRRLLTQTVIAEMTAPPGQPTPNQKKVMAPVVKAPIEPEPPKQDVIAEAVVVIEEAGLKVPAFLDRSNPLIAEEMTAKRKTAEADARKAMPLTGRDALKAIKKKRPAKAA